MTGMSKTATNKNTLKAGTCFALFLPNPETGSISMTTFSDPETFQLFKKKKKKKTWILFRKNYLNFKQNLIK